MNGIVAALNQVRDLEEKRRIAIDNGPASPGPDSDIMKIKGRQQEAFDRLCEIMEGSGFVVQSRTQRVVADQKKAELQLAREKAQAAREGRKLPNPSNPNTSNATKGADPVVASVSISALELDKVQSLTAKLQFSGGFSGIVQFTALVPDFGPMSIGNQTVMSGDADGQVNVATCTINVAGIRPIWTIKGEDIVAQIVFDTIPASPGMTVISLTPNVEHAALIVDAGEVVQGKPA
jgi:hypothetical protein